MKKLLKIVTIILMISLLFNTYEVKGADIQQRVYSTEMNVSGYGTITMAFIYDYNTSTQKKTFREWTTYKVKPVNGRTCWYRERKVVQDGKELKMTVTAQGYDYNTRQESAIYTFVKSTKQKI